MNVHDPHWGHSPRFHYMRGRCRVSCTCGKLNSVWFDTYVEAHAAYVRHTGVREERRHGRQGRGL